MQDIVLDQEGVRLAPLSAEDLPLLADLHADPAVSRYLTNGNKPWTLDQVSEFLDDTLIDQERHGFSAFKVLDSSGDLLGWAGFSALSETSEIAMRACYSRDAQEDKPELAEQVALQLIDWFFDNTYFSHIVLAVRTDDSPTRALARKLEFVYRESRRINGMPCDIFQLLSPSMRSYVLSA